MNAIISGCGTTNYLVDCVVAAKSRSGCDVYVVNSYPDVVCGSIHCPIHLINDIPEIIIEHNRTTQIRWMLAQWVIENLGINGPYYFPDWDDLVLHNIVHHIEALNDYEVLYTQDNGHCASAAKVIRTIDTLKAYNDYVRSYANQVAELWHLSDMNTWRLFCERNGLPRANLSAELDGGIFDHNIHTGGDIYATDDLGRKSITWDSGFPYFTRKENGSLIKAETIHCWNTYKTKTEELLGLAGLTRAIMP